MSEMHFKKLAEVQILHDYFLTTGDGTSFFERNKAGKEPVLVEKLAYGNYDIHGVLDIRPLEQTNSTMNEYRMILSRTPLGFVLGMEVTAEDQAGDTVFRPRRDVPDTVSLSFSMRTRMPFFRSITNLGFRSALPAIHYLTNKGRAELDEAVFPTYKSLQLTDKLRPHQPGMQYEMGALVDFGGTLREALQQTDGSEPAHWEDIKHRRYVSGADRTLLPHEFDYTIKKEDAVLDIAFVLEDAGGTPVKSISKSATEPLENLSLNFSTVGEEADSEGIPSGGYVLKVTANAGPELAYAVHLDDTLYDKTQWGVIDLRFDEPDSPYSLLDGDGLLKTRMTSADVLEPHPVFEVRFKNRRAYWRYNRDTPFTAVEVADTSAHLAPETAANERLVSLAPKALTETLVPFMNGAELMLPHPEISGLRVENDKIYSEVFLGLSNRLLDSS
ncbi:hypothetical protein RQM65_06220 [Pricia sp. S334]|uniref:Uncharacterized protein n=1 Tax=Pricia mediterranea TaxID=3076079 RepID=A0ABU3L4D9_9FLAO|nr:hypothetical protein [Pricia sp. S334]MDT7828253.1 hypothetical protein [Pricia sp. S334]